MTSDPIFITQVELADRWRISEATLERDRSLKKGVRYMKIGGLIRYRLEDVLAYENSRMRETDGKNEPTFIGLTLDEIEDIIKSNITITDYRLYEGVYAVATDIEIALKDKNEQAVLRKTTEESEK
jgi:hypothetical protein